MKKESEAENFNIKSYNNSNIFNNSYNNNNKYENSNINNKDNNKHTFKYY